MDFLWRLLWTGATLASVPVVLLLLWAAFYHWSHSDGTRQPHILSFLHFLLVLMFGLDYVLWKAGLINRYTFARSVTDFVGNLPFRDPRLTIKNENIKGVPVRVYQPKAPQRLRRGIVHIHGGAGVIGSVDTYERVSRHLANETDSVVFAVEYSLAPEHPYPLQFQQCLSVTVHVLEHAEDYGVDPARVIVCGDSFGGLLTAATVQVLGQRRDQPKPCAQILLYPILQMVRFNLPSYMQNAAVYPLSRKEALSFGLTYLKMSSLLVDLLLEGVHVPKETTMKYQKWLSAENIPEEFRKRETRVATPVSILGDILKLFKEMAGPKLSPLLVDNEVIQQLPKTFLLTCQYDVLRDDGILYKKRLEENGIPVSWCHLADGFHAALFFINCRIVRFSCCKRGMDRVVDFIRGL